MELNSPKTIREAYLQLLGTDSNYNKIFMELVNRKENEPIYNYQYLNPEDAPSYDNEQRELSEITLDLNSINNGLTEIKNRAASLFSTINTQADQIEASVKKETDRIMDINMICGTDSEYNIAIPIYVTDFDEGTGFEYIGDKTIGAYLTSQNTVDYIIVSISGNGYSGNDYVYNNDVFQNEEDDRSNYDYIKDDNTVTAYEYSRLITSSKEEAIDSLINYDNKECECIITLSTTEAVCKAEILSGNNNLVIKNIEVSQDGYSFTSALSAPLYLNSVEAVYNDSTYIYGSNIICFPYCYFVRITLSSNTVESDTIAIKAQDGDSVINYPNTKRKKVSINSIKLYSSQYNSVTIESKDILEAGSVDKAALFVSEYIPNHFTSGNYITYYLIINGTEYEIVPVNSSKDGIKIIKYSEQGSTATENYIQNIAETIKSARIKISISPYKNNETPYISNIKLCLGKDTGSIYVV